MLFVTDEFLLFFVVVYLGFWALPDRFRIAFLIGASLFFYATWSFLFMLHLLLVVAVNYAVMEIWRVYRKKWIFVALQIANVANIAVFKYYYLLADALGSVLGVQAWQDPTLRLAMRWEGTEIFLPLAISFYTFQIMAYGFDIYRGTYTERHSFSQVVLFKTFFPQLIAGPIMRSGELLPQLRNLAAGLGPRPDANLTRKGLWLIMIGVFKKIAIADQMLVYAAPLIGGDEVNPQEFAPAQIWIAIFACLIMLYADFSAYSDMARGMGWLLGFEIPINFKAPFLMYSLSEFWRRWHLTFSRWIRDYIFIPLGGSRVSEWRVYLNFFITFLIGGLWHGASYTFIVWGGLMGLMIAAEQFLERRGYPELPASWAGRLIRIPLAHIGLIVSSLFFFAPDWDWAGSAFVQMFNVFAFANPELAWLPRGEMVLYAALATALFHAFEEKPEWFRPLRRYEGLLLPLAGLSLALTLSQFAGGQKDFFYFQF